MGLVVLAGCGGGGGSGGTASTTPPAPTAQTDPDAYFTSVIEPGYDSYREYLSGDSYKGTTGLYNSTTAAIPTSGTATFKGYAELGMNLDNSATTAPRLGVEGTATITADFAKQTLSGSATNFVGTTVGNMNTTTGKYPFTGPANYYTGTIAITNGCIGTAPGCMSNTNANQFTADFAGTLNGSGNTMIASGQVQGNLKGTPLKGIATTTSTGTYTTNGISVPGNFAFFVKP